MRRFTALAITFAAPAFLLGCDDQSASNSTSEQLSDIAESAEDTLAETRDAFVEQSETRLEQLDARLAELRAEAESSEANATLQQTINEAEAAMAAIRQDLANLRNAAADQWETLRDSVMNSLNDLEAKLRDATGDGG